jgi:hypothetical protein
VGVGNSLIVELEEAIESGSNRRVTDLFVADADRLIDQQIEIFDDVLGHLIKRIESQALAGSADPGAKLEVVRRLPPEDDIAVPLLASASVT